MFFALFLKIAYDYSLKNTTFLREDQELYYCLKYDNPHRWMNAGQSTDRVYLTQQNGLLAFNEKKNDKKKDSEKSVGGL